MPFMTMKADKYTGVQIATLVANTNKQITFDPNANAIHIYHNLSAPVFFRIDGAASVPDKGATLVAEGFIAPGSDSARIITRSLMGADHTLNLICAGAGDVYYEFWVNGQ